MVSTPLKNISQIGNLPQIEVKIKNIWNHHLYVYIFIWYYKIMYTSLSFSLSLYFFLFRSVAKWSCWIWIMMNLFNGMQPKNASIAHHKQKIQRSFECRGVKALTWAWWQPVNNFSIHRGELKQPFLSCSIDLSANTSTFLHLLFWLQESLTSLNLQKCSVVNGQFRVIFGSQAVMMRRGCLPGPSKLYPSAIHELDTCHSHPLEIKKKSKSKQTTYKWVFP